MYLLLLLFGFLLPDLLLGYYLWRRKALPFRSLLKTAVIFAIFAIPIDIYATHRGVWNFDSSAVLGLWVFGLPIEEYLFYFIVIPLVILLFLFVEYKFKKQ